MTHPVLVDVTRGGHVESVHRGSLVLLGPDGTPELAVGESGPVFARSALKPLQATALVRAGWPGNVEAVALAAASHNGEPMHLDGVRRTLVAAELSETVLRCPASWPAPGALPDYVARGGRPDAVCHECSGEHAAMVATCAALDLDLDGYLDPDHPVQQTILAEVRARCGAVAYSSVDGCGAPSHAVPLATLAAAFGRIATADVSTPEGIVATAMRTHPELVGGTGRVVSELMAETDGLIAKDGAEGVCAAALPDGRAFAAKLDDGSARALSPLLAAIVRHWGHDGPALRRHAAVPVTAGAAGEVVGAVRSSSDLADLLGLPPLPLR